MRIALVHSYYSSPISGENSVVDAQRVLLQQRGHEIIDVCISSKQSPSPIDVLRMGLTTAHGFDFQGIVKNLEQSNPEVIFIHNLFPNFTDKLAINLKVPTIRFWHNYRFSCAAGTFYRGESNCFACDQGKVINGIRYKCYRNSISSTLPLTLSIQRTQKQLPNSHQLNFVQSEFMRGKLILAGAKPEKTFVVPNFVSSIPDDNRQPRKLSAITAGRLTTEKGFHKLVQEWPDEVELSIAGAGENQDLIANEIRLRQAQNIKVLGLLSSNSLAGEFSKNSIGVVPSLWSEGLPLVALQMLSAGLPIISLAENSVGKLVSDFDCGVTITQLERGKIQGALNTIMSNWSYYHEQAVKAFNRNYSPSAWIDTLNSIIPDGIRI